MNRRSLYVAAKGFNIILVDHAMTTLVIIAVGKPVSAHPHAYKALRHPDMTNLGSTRQLSSG